jgi:transcriptional regulator with XRE-family HTH domain
MPPSQLQVALGRLIRVERVRRGLRQAELARQAGIDRGRLSLIERGRVDLRLSQLEQLAHALGQRAEELLETARAEAQRSR